MKYFLITLGIFLIGIIAFLSSIKSSYNNLVTLQTSAQTKKAQVETELQRRWDLINQMVGSTKGALRHEEAIFDNIAKQQAAFINAQKQGDTQGELNASNQVSGAVGQLFRSYLVVQSQYPNEQALEFVRNLQVDIEGSENRISVARQRYNERVQEYNQARRTFPTVIIAGFMNFQDMQFYAADASSQKAPGVNLEK